MTSILALIFFLPSLALIISGIAVWRGKTSLIHAYHRNNVTDLKNYGVAMGKAILGMGVFGLCGSVVLLFGESLLWIGLGLFVFGIVSMMVVICFIQKKYNGGLFG